MATCGYICPACEGKGYDDKGNLCQWCSVVEKLAVVKPSHIILDDEEWIKKTHEGSCCAGEE